MVGGCALPHAVREKGARTDEAGDQDLSKDLGQGLRRKWGGATAAVPLIRCAQHCVGSKAACCVVGQVMILRQAAKKC